MLHPDKSASQIRIHIFQQFKWSKKCEDWIQHPHQPQSVQNVFQQYVNLQAVHVRGPGYPQHLPQNKVCKQHRRQSQWGQMSPQWEVYKVKTWIPFSEVISQFTESLNKTKSYPVSRNHNAQLLTPSIMLCLQHVLSKSDPCQSLPNFNMVAFTVCGCL